MGAFAELEDQMCAMRPDGYAGDGRPARCTGIAITELSAPPNVAYIFGGGVPVQRLGGLNRLAAV